MTAFNSIVRWFIRQRHSMRTRSYVVAFLFLLVLLAVFAAGGLAFISEFVLPPAQEPARTVFACVMGILGGIGVLFMVPTIWVLHRIVIYPILRMTRSIRRLGERVRTDEGRLNWSGDDEFAQLAVSVNAMLDAIMRQGEAVRVSEERKKAILRGLPDALAVFGRHGRLISLDKQPEGVEPLPGLAVGRGLDADIWGDEGVYQFTETLDVAFLSGTLGHTHLVAYGSGKDGEARHFDVRISRVGGTFAVAIFRDITQFINEQRRLAEMQTQLARSRKQESLATFAAGIAHDVNNILAIIINTIEIAWVDQIEGRGLTQKALDSVRVAVRRGSALTRELMTFSGTGRISLKRTPVATIISELRRMAEGIVPKGIEISFLSPGPLPDVDVDMDQIWNLFLNLLKNAVEAMNGSGYVIIKAEPFTFTREASRTFKFDHPFRPVPGVLFSLSDTGPGISAERLERIFEPYVSSKPGNRGLGLANVVSIVNAHEGAISVASELGQGTVFSIFLPAAAPSAPETLRGGTASCIIVDDDDLVLRTTGILLRVMKVEVNAAHDRNEALSLFRRADASLRCVIFDAHFGESSDVKSLISSFRAIAPKVPIVIMSGSSRDEIERLFDPSDYDLFLAKPFTLADLKSTFAAAASVVRPTFWK